MASLLILRAVARRILEICELRKVRLVVEHLQGIHNVVADRLSRWPMDRSDWSLNRSVFSYLDRRWGPHSIDFFATRNNAQLPRFVSWAADDAATYVDALQNLHRKENGYANPPFAVIGQVLEKLWRTSRELTIIVPAWPGQPWWPRLLEMFSDTPVLLPAFSSLRRVLPANRHSRRGEFSPVAFQEDLPSEPFIFGEFASCYCLMEIIYEEDAASF